MPSSNTWWWIGIGLGVTALTGTGAALIYRGRKPSFATPDRTPFPPPIPPPAGLDEDIVLVIPVIPDPIKEEICRQWKTGSSRPDWRPELYEYLDAAVNSQIDRQDVSWSSVAELEQKSFRVTKAALRSLCPDVPVPNRLSDISTDPKFRSFYWTELWSLLWDRAYNRIGDFSF